MNLPLNVLISLMAASTILGCKANSNSAQSPTSQPAEVVAAIKILKFHQQLLEKPGELSPGPGSAVERYLNISELLATLEGSAGLNAHRDRLERLVVEIGKRPREESKSQLTTAILDYHFAKLRLIDSSAREPSSFEAGTGWNAVADAAHKVDNHLQNMQDLGIALDYEWAFRRCVWWHRVYEAESHIGNESDARQRYIARMVEFQDKIPGGYGGDGILRRYVVWPSIINASGLSKPE